MPRQKFTAEKKVLILRDHLENKVPVSDICEKYRIHPNQLYQWKKAFFENAVDLFATKKPSNDHDGRVSKLEQKIKERNEVIAELMEENLKLKKLSGEA